MRRTKRKSHKINFVGRPDYACGTDELRPIMTYIYFNKGNMVATDGHVMVKIPLSLSGLEDYSEDLEGYLVHPKQYREIIKHQVIKIEKGLITGFNNGYSVTYHLKKATDIQDKGYPDYESVMGYESHDINKIGLMASKFNQLAKCFYKNNYTVLRLKFQEKGAIHIIPESSEFEGQIGILMPCVLSDNYFNK